MTTKRRKPKKPDYSHYRTAAGFVHALIKYREYGKPRPWVRLDNMQTDDWFDGTKAIRCRCKSLSREGKEYWPELVVAPTSDNSRFGDARCDCEYAQMGPAKRQERKKMTVAAIETCCIHCLKLYHYILKHPHRIQEIMHK